MAFEFIFIIVDFIFVIFLKPNDYIYYALFCLFTGFFGGANIVIPPIIIAKKIKDTKREYILVLIMQ